MERKDILGADYCYIKGVPHLKLGKEGSSFYFIVKDPYQKRYSVETRDRKGQFTSVIYDSYLFDFRWLFRREMQAFERVQREKDSVIVDQEGRALLLEKEIFEGDLPRSTLFYHPQGLFVAKQSMFYTHLGDPFNGVAFLDRIGKPALIKEYVFDQSRQIFTGLLRSIEDFSVSNDVMTFVSA